MLFGRLLWERWHIVVAPGERGESCGGPETLCASMLFIYLRPTDATDVKRGGATALLYLSQSGYNFSSHYICSRGFVLVYGLSKT
jgi:hypothetical protein